MSHLFLPSLRHNHWPILVPKSYQTPILGLCNAPALSNARRSTNLLTCVSPMRSFPFVPESTWPFCPLRLLDDLLLAQYIVPTSGKSGSQHWRHWRFWKVINAANAAKAAKSSNGFPGHRTSTRQRLQRCHGTAEHQGKLGPVLIYHLLTDFRSGTNTVFHSY